MRQVARRAKVSENPQKYRDFVHVHPGELSTFREQPGLYIANAAVKPGQTWRMVGGKLVITERVCTPS